jgi:outer membrane receptor protein involved in Fe transport
LGNQNVGTYPYQDVLSTTSYAFSTLEPGVRLTRLVDRRLKWETTTITDIGLDVSIKNGLFYLTADWFNKFTDDILYSIPVPASIGLSAPTINGGQMKNTGWDFELGHSNQLGQVNYTIDFNLSAHKNEVVSILSPTYGTNTVQEGLPYNSYYMIEWIGIFQNQAEIDQGPTHPFNPKPGDLKFKDQNGDGIINASDRVVVDGFYPKFYYGGSLNLSFKNFDVSAFFQGIEGVKNYVLGRQPGLMPFAQGSPPTMDLVKNRWTEDNPTDKYPAIYESTYQPVNGTPSTFGLQDASYLRLKNLRIGYTLPPHVVQRIGFKNAHVYFSGDNLLTFTDYPGADPERSSFTSNYSVYPQLTSYAFGIKVKL